LFLNDITPSQRKVRCHEYVIAVALAHSDIQRLTDLLCIQYYEMILSWGGWALFQELLRALETIASKHGVSIANVATRWVLDFEYVGAVLVGSRMGVSERADENLAAYGWHLDECDKHAIEQVLRKSHRAEIFEAMGDCGGEYR